MCLRPLLHRDGRIEQWRQSLYRNEMHPYAWSTRLPASCCFPFSLKKTGIPPHCLFTSVKFFDGPDLSYLFFFFTFRFFLKLSPEDMFIDFFGERKGGRERETLAASHTRPHRIEPAAWVCALTGKPTPQIVDVRSTEPPGQVLSL